MQANRLIIESFGINERWDAGKWKRLAYLYHFSSNKKSDALTRSALTFMSLASKPQPGLTHLDGSNALLAVSWPCTLLLLVVTSQQSGQ